MENTENEEIIIGSISLLANKLNQIGDEIIPDITFKQFILLITISKLEGNEKNINRISEEIGTTRQNIKKMLVPLQTKGYISIIKSQADARSLNVELTKKTLEYFEENASHTFHATKQLFQNFTKQEVLDFAQYLLKLMHCFDMQFKRSSHVD